MRKLSTPESRFSDLTRPVEVSRLTGLVRGAWPTRRRPLTSRIGRERRLIAAATLVRSGDHRTLALRNPGGGKTRFARRAAVNLSSTSRHTVEREIAKVLNKLGGLPSWAAPVAHTVRHDLVWIRARSPGGYGQSRRSIASTPNRGFRGCVAKSPPS